MWNGIELLIAIQNITENLPAWVDSIFIFFSSPVIYEAIPILIAMYFLWFSDKRKAELVAISAVAAMSLVHFVKYIFKVPRPWVQNPEIHVPSPEARATGYSFPSGHAAIGGSAYGSFLPFTKNKFLIAGIITLIGLICFARLYFCAHTPLDIIGGLAIAVAVVLLNTKILAWMHLSENNMKKGTIGYLAFFAIITVLTQIMVDGDRNETLLLSGFQFGAVIGLYLNHRYFSEVSILGTAKKKIFFGILFAVVGLCPLVLYTLDIEAVSFLCSLAAMMIVCVLIPYLTKRYLA